MELLINNCSFGAITAENIYANIKGNLLPLKTHFKSYKPKTFDFRNTKINFSSMAEQYFSYYKYLVNNLNSSEPFIIIGGDHSYFISVAKYLETLQEDLLVLYIDQHMDLHTPVSSPSGNLHGMPLAIAYNLDKQEQNKYFYDLHTNLNPNNLILIGQTSYEDPEIFRAVKYGIPYVNLGKVKYSENFTKFIKLKTEQFRRIHISLDLDIFETKSVYYKNHGTRSMSLQDFEAIIQNLPTNAIISLDIAEYNHKLDLDKSGLKLINDIITIFNKYIGTQS